MTESNTFLMPGNDKKRDYVYNSRTLKAILQFGS